MGWELEGNQETLEKKMEKEEPERIFIIFSTRPQKNPTK